jgi:hypothetical protein
MVVSGRQWSPVVVRSTSVVARSMSVVVTSASVVVTGRQFLASYFAVSRYVTIDYADYADLVKAFEFAEGRAFL